MTSVSSALRSLAAVAVVRLGLPSETQARVAEPAVSRLRYFEGPSWWPTESAMRHISQAYAGATIVVWVDAERRRAFLQRAGFAPTSRDQ